MLQHLKFDTSTKAFLPGETDDNSNPIPIALDTISGVTYRKIAQHMPWSHARPHTELQVQKNSRLADTVESGGIHVAHDEEHFRGVWVPLAAADTAMEDDGPQRQTVSDVERGATRGAVETNREAMVPTAGQLSAAERRAADRDHEVGDAGHRRAVVGVKTASGKVVGVDLGPNLRAAAKKAAAKHTPAKPVPK